MPELTRENYVPSGGTALYDAIARRVAQVESSGDFDKVVFAILTDGQENSSRRFSANQARELIRRKEDDGWVFLYLAATADEFTVEQAHLQADALGIHRGQRLAFSKKEQVHAAMAQSQRATSRYLRGEATKEEFFKPED